MRKKNRHHGESSSHERWLVSYADLMTLLFAFFVVMYGMSSINEQKFRVLTGAMTGAFRHQDTVSQKSVLVDPLSPEILKVKIRKQSDTQYPDIKKERVALTRTAIDIRTVLAKLVQQGQVSIVQNSKGVVVAINASILFEPGDAKLSSSAIQALRAVALILKDDYHNIIVEGHTDDVPIKNAFYASNWELSAVRASSVVRLFNDTGVPEGRLLASGRSSTQPVEKNDSPEGRAKNRRVTILISSGGY